jgi:hypothetical protein
MTTVDEINGSPSRIAELIAERDAYAETANRLAGKVRMVAALADRYALDGGDARKRNVADSIRTLLAD